MVKLSDFYSHRSLGMLGPIDDVEDYINSKMGFTSYFIRNKFIEDSIGTHCYGRSPCFDSHEDLKVFVNWFEKTYEKRRMVLSKSNFKDLL